LPNQGSVSLAISGVAGRRDESYSGGLDPFPETRKNIASFLKIRMIGRRPRLLLLIIFCLAYCCVLPKGEIKLLLKLNTANPLGHIGSLCVNFDGYIFPFILPTLDRFENVQQ